MPALMPADPTATDQVCVAGEHCAAIAFGVH